MSGIIVLPAPPPDGIPIVKAKLIRLNELSSTVFAGILVPEDGEKRHGWIEFRWRYGPMNVHSKVVASACEGHGEWAHLGEGRYHIFNVVPTAHELQIRLLVEYGRDLDVRVHIIVFR